MNINRSIFAALVLFAPVAAVAQEAATTEHRMQSAALEQERAVTVHLPASYEQTVRDYPVLYLLDGELNLAYARAVGDFLADNGLIPEMIVVAVHSGGTRGYDYAPETVDRGGVPGRADRVLDYMANELIPWVEASYRAAPLRLISGHSLGGALVTYAMSERPELFRAYLTQSPYYAGDIATDLLARITAALPTLATSDDFFYMTLGDEPDLEESFDRVATTLAQADGAFRSVAHREPGKAHMTTRLIGHYDGLERFFAHDWPLSPDAAGDAEAFAAHIDALTEAYGYPVLYGEAPFRQATQQALSQRDSPAAGTIAALYAEHYPRSPVAWFLSGVALARGGDRDTALVAIERAIELYEAHPAPELAPTYETMKQVRAQLGGTQ